MQYFTVMHCVTLYRTVLYSVLGATHAVLKHASVPASKARGANADTSDTRLGTNMANIAIIIPGPVIV